MKVTEKKFNLINVGSKFMTEEYQKQLESKGYELVGKNTGQSGEVDTYMFELKENFNEGE